MVFCICQPCARDSCNKVAASAHGMGSGGLAVDAMAIGCVGVERRGERFFVLSHFSSLLFKCGENWVIPISENGI